MEEDAFFLKQAEYFVNVRLVIQEISVNLILVTSKHALVMANAKLLEQAFIAIAILAIMESSANLLLAQNNPARMVDIVFLAEEIISAHALRASLGTTAN